MSLMDIFCSSNCRKTDISSDRIDRSTFGTRMGETKLKAQTSPTYTDLRWDSNYSCCWLYFCCWLSRCCQLWCCCCCCWLWCCWWCCCRCCWLWCCRWWFCCWLCCSWCYYFWLCCCCRWCYYCCCCCCCYGCWLSSLILLKKQAATNFSHRYLNWDFSKYIWQIYKSTLKRHSKQ